MHIIRENRIEGNQHYEGDVCFENNCEIKGDLTVKGVLTGKTLRINGKLLVEGGDVYLKGDLEAFEIEIGAYLEKVNNLSARNVSSRGTICVTGEIRASDSIFAGVPLSKYGTTREEEKIDRHDKEIQIFSKDKIVARGDIISAGDIHGENGIISGGDIISGGTIWADALITAKGDIECRKSLMGRAISAGKSIKCGWYINCDYELKCKGKIFAGLHLKDIPEPELQKGPTIYAGEVIGKIVCGIKRKYH